jgi:hypothetical protein
MKSLLNFCLIFFDLFISSCYCEDIDDIDRATAENAIMQYNSSSMMISGPEFKTPILTDKVMYTRCNSEEIYFIKDEKFSDNRHTDFVIKTTVKQKSFEKLKAYLSCKNQKVRKSINISFFQGKSAVGKHLYFSIMNMAKGEAFIDIMKDLIDNATVAKYKNAKIACSALGVALANLHKEGDFNPGTALFGPTSRLIHNDLNCGNVLYDPDYGITFIDTADFDVDQPMLIEEDLRKLINTTIFLPFVFLDPQSEFITQDVKGYIKDLFIEFTRSYINTFRFLSVSAVFKDIIQKMIQLTNYSDLVNDALRNMLRTSKVSHISSQIEPVTKIRATLTSILELL